MKPVDGIRRHGFRRWHERELIEGHAWFVSCFLSGIAIVACIEAFSPRAPGLEPLMLIGVVVGCAVLCAVSLRRYLAILARAEQIAGHATCPACSRYGSLEVLDVSPARTQGDHAHSAGDTFDARCRRCGHVWKVG